MSAAKSCFKMKKLFYLATTTLLLFSCGKENNESQKKEDPGDQEFSFTAIDLGLSVKWGNANLGATAPEGYGDYYAWGETEIKEDYSWLTYKWCNGDYNKLTKYNGNPLYGYVDYKDGLESNDDVAYIRLGGNWRMPTVSEMSELLSTRNNPSYQWEWKSLNGHNGWMVTYLVTNNSIFLPAAGRRYYISIENVGSYCCYWSSSRNPECPDQAHYMLFTATYAFSNNTLGRFGGFSVRPVSE